MDQAERLRYLFQQNSAKRCRVITVTGGKGGTGKTCISVNLSIALKKLGYKVLIVDADIGFSNAEIELGVVSNYTLYDVLYGNKKIVDVINDGPVGVKFISTGGNFDLVNGDIDLNVFFNNIKILDNYFDYIIVDTGAGVNKTVKSFIDMSDDVIIVTTPEPTAIMDAYILIKTINDLSDKNLYLIVNKVANQSEYVSVYERLNNALINFLGASIINLGFIHEDAKISECIKMQIPIVLKYQYSKPSKDIARIAEVLTNYKTDKKKEGLLGIFRKMFLNGGGINNG
ncbi:MULTISPECIES: MinD/ParA family ATP-binding protein [Thermoanaerobacterium]|uniref:Cobyrinic acid ac-diamide synthase n=2 Tax=Thermoanaerobacterium TaxID=28895 RepID=W9EFR7_9THEO|nr:MULTISPECIES: AAA family ATPase [Thermoanaerobacterium]AFK86808.1 Cobyrinic acid ac-diamide synthase [Thermoanaerobacterium saccharolyticum JW/SL-YS485]ETO38574.1 Cobyrinic acid ac-diamide synthase [Thermoanaerobacterium aotearoense SCUT27]